MTPETSLFLDKADRTLQEADAMVSIALYDPAGRTAYLAAFHAAPALISERTGRSVKTHAGVHSEFHRLTKNDIDLPVDLRAFLRQAYNLKSHADYDINPDSGLSPDRAEDAVATAKRFVAWFRGKLAEE